MTYRTKAVYHAGAFVPETRQIPEDAKVDLLVQGPFLVMPVITDPQQRARILRQITQRMKQNPIPVDAPRFPGMSYMNAVDTNVLVYAHDPRNPEKHAVAISLIESLTEVALVWQVACEYVSASKRLESFGYSREQAWQDVRELRMVWAAVLPSWEIMDRVPHLMDQYGLSFWDAMIVAACLDAGVTRLYSEDFAREGGIDGLDVVNPFSPRP